MLSSHCDNVLPYAAAGRRAAALLDHRRYRPNVEVAPNCPRCDSPNTKFCYYNNYSLSQPRYFCKGCRRYWTKGGSLRNVPVGGGCRKNRRGKPLRAAINPAVDAGAAAAAFSHRSAAVAFHGTAALRPDMLLEGMVAGPAALCHPMDMDDAAAADKPAVVEGSTIDLALLYAKFLNHQPPAAGAVEPCAAILPESRDTMSGGSSSSDMSPDVPPPPPADHRPLARHDAFSDLPPAPTSADPGGAAARRQCPDVDDTSAEAAAALGELGFTVDQSCYDSLGLPADDGDLVLPSTWRPDHHAKYEPFDPLPEDAMGLHGGGISGGDDTVWSSALACQGLEAALCRP